MPCALIVLKPSASSDALGARIARKSAMVQFGFRFRYALLAVAICIAMAWPVPTRSQAEDSATPFDNRSLVGWTTTSGKPVESGWEVVDGEIHLKKDGRRAGHTITADEFGDFSFTFEGKIAPGGNSGIKYLDRDYGGKLLGGEFQIYDDDGKRKPMPNKCAAA